MPPLSSRLLFSQSALRKYFEHISLPSRFSTPPSVQAARSGEGLSYLQALQKYQQATVPFANLYLHYSRHHTSTLNSHELYEYIVNGGAIAREGHFSPEIVGQGWHATTNGASDAHDYPAGGKVGKRSGRGGSCSLNNGFFGTILRSLGYSVRSTGARVAAAAVGGPKDIFGGWSHMTNLVDLEGKRYLVDVGFGGNGPTEPVLLEDGREVSWGATEDAVRVVWQRLPQHEHEESRCWVLQHRMGGKREWNDIYAFTETEFLPEDLEVLNYRSTKDPKSWFNQKVVCVKTVLEGEADDITGVLLLTNGKLKWRVRGQNTTLADCKSEEDRVQVLRDHFGIVLSKEEREGIKGMVTELKG